MEKSRPGAIQSWMLDMHSNVPQSFRNPAMKEMTQRTGILCTCMHSRLHRAIPSAALRRSCRLVNRQLESEQERERHTYADDSAQSYHQYILTHEGCGSHHVGQCPEIDSAAELEYYREEHINPWADILWNEFPIHRHREYHRRHWHINTSLQFPH